MSAPTTGRRPGPLAPEQLRRVCDPEGFDFETTEELSDLDEALGQDRALQAIEFGIGIRARGYNIFAFGPPATGKHHLVRRFLEEEASRRPAPPDLCYVNDFDHPERPKLLQLPSGTAARFGREMEQLVEDLLAALTAAAESDEHQARRQRLEEEMKGRSDEAFDELAKRAEREGLGMLRTPLGIVFPPLKDGEALEPEELERMDEEERRRLQERIEALQQELRKLFLQMPRWRREMRERLRKLEREVAEATVRPLVEEMRKRHAEAEAVGRHLDALERDVIARVGELVAAPAQREQGEQGPAQQPLAERRRAQLKRYRVNVLVEQDPDGGAPVVHENNPNYQNLIGRIEHVPQMGALVTDFTLIRAGALHRANGGYLVLEAHRLLTQPFAWEALKRALESRRLRLEAPGQALGLISTVSLEPEPLPLDVKVVLLGEPYLYYLLAAYDPDFGGLFKVAADFDDRTLRDDGIEPRFARLLATLVRHEELRHLDRTGVAAVVEQAARQVGDGERLSTQIGRILDLLREADHWAGIEGRELVGAAEVHRAVEARIYRGDRLRQRTLEATLRGLVFIDTAGARVGQINGLAAYELGDLVFGHPARITARVRLGKGEVVSIEREVELGGPLHSKGVLILSNFLAARYAASRPLSLAASLVFEQSYAGVEGDSASAAELFALLSAISGIPIRQSLAVTGSVNQHGEIQAIGAVNEKIEGYFELCRERGLTCEQGVLIPAANVPGLMLDHEVVDAVREGTFHIYPITTVDEGIETLTDVPAGELDAEGEYPEGTINRAVADRLADFAHKWAEYVKGAAAEEDEEDEGG